MSHTLAELVRRAADRLREQESPYSAPDLDAEVLARHVLGWDRARWLADNRIAPPPDFLDRYEELLRRRLSLEPVAYITGVKEFYGLEFEVSPAVLIPRPETELLVDEAMRVIDATGASTLADVGTGSGCIAVAVAHARPRVRVIATDISEDALALARRNARRHDVGDRIAFTQANVLDGVGAVDLVLSNPPYIAPIDRKSMMQDVVDFEPHTALFAEGDGLGVIRAILDDIRARRPVPQLILEFGRSEAAVRDAVTRAGLRTSRIIRDLQGIPRIAVVEA